MSASFKRNNVVKLIFFKLQLTPSSCSGEVLKGAGEAVKWNKIKIDFECKKLKTKGLKFTNLKNLG